MHNLWKQTTRTHVWNTSSSQALVITINRHMSFYNVKIQYGPDHQSISLNLFFVCILLLFYSYPYQFQISLSDLPHIKVHRFMAQGHLGTSKLPQIQIDPLI